MNKILLNPDPVTGSSGTVGSEQQQDETAVNLFGDPGNETPNEGGNAPAAGEGGEAGGEAGAAGGEAQKPNGQYTVTAEVLAEAMRQSGFAAPTAQQQQQAPPQMTEAEFDRMFHTFEPSDELLAGIYSDDPAARKAAFRQMGKLMVKNSLALAAHFQQQEAQKIRAEYAPALEDMTARQRAKLESDFYGKHKDLVGSEPLVNMVANQLQASGWTGTNEQAFEKVATQVRATLNQVLAKGQQQQNAPGQQQQQTRQTAPKMSTVSTGGRGGAATGSNKAAPKTTAFALFGPRK